MTSAWRGPICAFVVALHSCVAPSAMQRPDVSTPELAWIGLFTGELVEWLENGNRLTELCPARVGSDEWRACQAATLEPRLMVIPVRSEPRAAAARVGEIVVVAWPGQGLKVFASSGPVAVPFNPDLFDPDWGYGPWFHQSILARSGSWFRVPLPSIGAGWIDAQGWVGSGAAIKTVQAGDIVTTPRGDMLVLGVDNRVLRSRPEQTADMWCAAGDPPALSAWQEARIPFEELLDQAGHFLIRYKYTRGC